jgi:hypothetical protein
MEFCYRTLNGCNTIVRAKVQALEKIEITEKLKQEIVLKNSFNNKDFKI